MLAAEIVSNIARLVRVADWRDVIGALIEGVRKLRVQGDVRTFPQGQG
jgi:hypothetical protein